MSEIKRTRNISIQPAVNQNAFRNRSQNVPRESDFEHNRFKTPKLQKEQAEKLVDDSSIMAEAELKCTKNGCLLEIVDVIHNIIGNKNQHGPKKEQLIFIGTYFGNLIAYKIIPQHTTTNQKNDAFYFDLAIVKQWKFNSQVTSLVWYHQFNKKLFWHFDNQAT